MITNELILVNPFLRTRDGYDRPVVSFCGIVRHGYDQKWSLGLLSKPGLLEIFIDMIRGVSDH